MATEDDLRSSMQSGGGRGRIDVDAVIRRSRGRRRTKELLIGGATTLALLGFVVPATLGVLGPGMTTAGGTAESADAPVTDEEVVPFSERGADEDGDLDGQVYSLDDCTATALSPEKSLRGLELELEFPATADADADSVAGTVTLTNTSDDVIHEVEVAASPSIRLSRNGSVIWRTPFVEHSWTTLELQPGDSTQFATTFTPLECNAESTGTQSAEPGDYRVSAELLVDFPLGPDVFEHVTSAATTITLE